MKARVTSTVIAVLISAVVAAQQVAPPPQPLHFVDGHWTPYDPPSPEEYPEGATVHIVERGDTLWDLASRYLGDPYLWPQIWERNPYILDSHWIYPGDPILVDVAVQPPPGDVEEVVEDDTTVSEIDEIPVEPVPGEPFGAEEVDAGIPSPLGSASDVYCFARLVDEEVEFPFTIASAERAQFQSQFSEGDIVYLDGGVAQGVRAGDRFFVLSRHRPLFHPVSNAKMGILYRQVGQVTVLCAQDDTSIAEITYACDPVMIGHVLEPFSPVPVPLVVPPDPTDRCDEPNGKPVGYLVYNRDDIIDAGTEHTVMVDLGNDEGLYPGQFATVFRENPVEGFPRVIVGEVGILTVEDGYSTAKITRSWTPVGVGDRIELK